MDGELINGYGINGVMRMGEEGEEGGNHGIGENGMGGRGNDNDVGIIVYSI